MTEKESKNTSKKTAKPSKAATIIMGNIAMTEATKSLHKENKKIVAPKAVPKAKVATEVAIKVSDVSPELQDLLDKVAASMKDKSEGTTRSALSLITAVCRKYGVSTIDADLAKKAVEESGLPPKSRANLKWACAKAIAASA